MKKVLSLLILLISIHFSQAQAPQAQDFSAYQRQLFIWGTDTLRYRILYPEDYNKKKKYPLIVFLHGSGERGNNNESQLFHGGDLFLKDSLRKAFPAIVIFPQCPDDSTWSRFPSHHRDSSAAFNAMLNISDLTTPERLVKMLIDSFVGNKIADKKRLYLGGLSLGGFGTYDLVIHYPTFFAAVFPICGMANLSLYTEKAAKVPIWIFHGALDKTVDPQPDRNLIKALQAMGAKNAKYTEYPNANHDSWDSAFAEPGLFPWLFSFKK